jgi:hypothetical protein
MAKIGKIIRLHQQLWDWLKAYADKKTAGNLTQAVEEIILEKSLKRNKKNKG